MLFETLSVFDVIIQNPRPTLLSVISLLAFIILFIYFYKHPDTFNRFEKSLSASIHVSIRVVFMIVLIMCCGILFYGVLLIT